MSDVPITIHYQQMEQWLNDRKAVFARKYKKPYLALVALAPRLVQLLQYDIPALQKQIKKESNALSQCHRICEEAQETKAKMCKKQAEMLVSYELVTKQCSNAELDDQNGALPHTTLSQCNMPATLAQFDLDEALDKRITLARHRLAVALMRFVREHVTEFSVQYNNIVRQQMDMPTTTQYNSLQHHFPWLHRLLQQMHLPLREANLVNVHKTDNAQTEDVTHQQSMQQTVNDNDDHAAKANSLPSIDWGDFDDNEGKTVQTNNKLSVSTQQTSDLKTNTASTKNTNIPVTATIHQGHTKDTNAQKEVQEVIEIRWDAADDESNGNTAMVDNATTITSTNHVSNDKRDDKLSVINLQSSQPHGNFCSSRQQYAGQFAVKDADLPQPLFVCGVQYVSVDLARSRDRSHVLTQLQAMKCFCEVRRTIGELKNSIRVNAIEALIEDIKNSKDAQFVRMLHNYRLRDNFAESVNYYTRAVSAATQRQVSHRQKIHQVEAQLQRLQPQLTQLCNKAKEMRDEAITHVKSMFPDRTVIIAGDINKYLVYCNE